MPTNPDTAALMGATRTMTTRFGGKCAVCGADTVAGVDHAMMVAGKWLAIDAACMVPEGAVARALEAAITGGIDAADERVGKVLDLFDSDPGTAISYAMGLRLQVRKAAGKPADDAVVTGLHRTPGDDVSGPQVFLVQYNKAGTNAYAKQWDSRYGEWVYIGKGPLARLSEATLMSRADAEDLGMGKTWDRLAKAADKAEAAKPIEYTGASIPVGYFAVTSITGNNDLDFFGVKHDADGGYLVRRVIGGRSDKAIGGTQARKALEAIEAAGPEAAGFLFAMELGHCRKCNRHLTDEVSRATGIGPECAGR